MKRFLRITKLHTVFETRRTVTEDAYV